MSLANSEILNLRRAIASLRRHASERIDSLHGQLKLDFETVTRYAVMLQGTSNYEILDRLIREQFDSINSAADETIGLSVAGCLISEKYGNNGCSPSCLGNIQTTNTVPCDETVIVAISKGDGYFFITKNVGKKEYARLYLSEYKGLSIEEKNFLFSNNITAVILVDFQDRPIYINGSNIHYVESLPERQEKSYLPADPSTTDDKIMLYLVFIIIFALLLAIIFIIAKSRY